MLLVAQQRLAVVWVPLEDLILSRYLKHRVGILRVLPLLLLFGHGHARPCLRSLHEGTAVKPGTATMEGQCSASVQESEEGPNMVQSCGAARMMLLHAGLLRL